MTVKRRLSWPGWAGAVDEELAKAGGALPWKRLRALVVLRYRDQVADGGASSDDGRSLGDLALASVPEAYTSICDDLVRLPPATSAATAGSKDAESWPHWVSTCREELQRAGGALKWKVLQELLVARYLSATGSASGSVDMQVLRRHALAQIPEEYLSEEDRFVRLPSAADAAPPQSTSPTEGKASIASKLCLHITPCGDEAAFAEQLSSAAGKLVVVDFSAIWCGACQRIRPDLHDLAAEMSEVVFLEVDVDANAGLANRFGVKSMPSFLFFRDAACVGRLESDDIDELSVQVLMNM